ncbi:MAG: cytochrome c4 [Aquabacterium sp.]|nr:cytochrome c4 [Aquabacterium sp.]
MKRLLATMIAAGALLTALPGRAADVQPGNVKTGATHVAMCIGCHGIPGYQSSFPQVHKVPMISGQSAAYITAALQGYKKGERKHPTMRAIAGSLSDQQIADIAAYYESQVSISNVPDTAAQPPKEVAELLTRGNCASCHGANFNKPIPGYPKLAGQHADYLLVALKAYQTSDNAKIGRGNAIMAGMAKPFSHEELKLLADYIGSLPGSLATVPQSRFKTAQH